MRQESTLRPRRVGADAARQTRRQAVKLLVGALALAGGSAAVPISTAAAAPTASYSYSPSSPEAGKAVRFDASASSCGSSPCTYTWKDDGPDGPGGTQWDLGTGVVLTKTFQNAGTKWVRLTVRDAAGTTATTMKQISIAKAGTPSPPPPSTSCDRSATTSTLASQFSAATAGQTICLASGSYGTFSGAAKSGRVTLRAQSGATASMALNFNGASNITLDGLTITGATLLNSTHDITIRNSQFTGFARMDGLSNSNVLLDHNTHNNINSCNSGCYPARIWLSYGSDSPSGVTVQNSQMIGGSSDGIQAGPAMTILNNELANIVEGSCSACHTDAIQLYSGSSANVGSTIRGNFIHDSSTGIVAFDGTGHNDIEHNVIWSMHSHGITIGGDKGSTIAHNTVRDVGPNAAGLDLTSKSGQQSVGTVVKDNILKSIALTNGVGGPAQPATNTNNMLGSGATGANFNGTPTFAGGSDPGTFSGFALAAGSAGKNRATDGSDVGI
jgi:hypothetical protein